jgi:hypothetical protein
LPYRWLERLRLTSRWLASLGWGRSSRHRAPLLPSLSLGPLVPSLGALLRQGPSCSKLPGGPPPPCRCRDVGGELGARTKRLAVETSVGSSAQEQRGSLSRRRWGARRKNKEARCRDVGGELGARIKRRAADVRGKSVARQRGGLSRRRVRVRAQEEEGALSKTPLSKSSPRRQSWGGLPTGPASARAGGLALIRISKYCWPRSSSSPNFGVNFEI